MEEVQQKEVKEQQRLEPKMQQQEKQDKQQEQQQDEMQEHQQEVGECRICLQPGAGLVAPCACKGSLRFTHRACLLAWASERGSLSCELCKSRYVAALLTELEPAVAAAVRGRRRAAATAAGHRQAAVGSGGDGGDEGWVPRTREGWFWLRFLLVAVLVAATLYLLLFLGSKSSEHRWADVVSAGAAPCTLNVSFCGGCDTKSEWVCARQGGERWERVVQPSAACMPPHARPPPPQLLRVIGFALPALVILKVGLGLAQCCRQRRREERAAAEALALEAGWQGGRESNRSRQRSARQLSPRRWWPWGHQRQQQQASRRQQPEQQEQQHPQREQQHPQQQQQQPEPAPEAVGTHPASHLAVRVE